MTAFAALTFDVDWAPESCIQACVDLCLAHGVPATFFVTHPSPTLARLRGDARFELGIHPNFLSGSSHGHGLREVLDHVLECAPGARVMRTHALFQSSPLFALVADAYPQLECDASLHLPGHSPLLPVDLYPGVSRRRLTRLPYLWEDDTMFADPGWDWRWEFDRPGLVIYDFHPVHVALNAADMTPYNDLRRETAGTPLPSLAPAAWGHHVRPGRGAGWFLREVLRHTPAAAFHTLSALVAAHRAGQIPSGWGGPPWPGGPRRP